jgi:hypothetical protein
MTVNGSGPATPWMTEQTLESDLDESVVPGVDVIKTFFRSRRRRSAVGRNRLGCLSLASWPEAVACTIKLFTSIIYVIR